jgi:hypothetical protein
VVEMRTTPGAPYSGEATTEFVQALSDGNRITRKSVVRIYRDSEGRVRRENVAADGRIESVTIVDPVSGSSVMLEPETRTAYGEAGRGGRGRSETAVAVLREVERKKAAELETREHSGTVVYPAPPPPPPAPLTVRPRTARGDGRPEQPTVQDLGQRTIDGVTVRGTRATTVLPAGAIGNEQPIRIISEEWFSPELQVLVQTKHSDPRSGDTTYTLSNVVRAEPDRSLFEVPADYSFKPASRREQ